MTWFAVRCITFGFLWALGVVAAMIWSMETAPTVWGCWKLGAAGAGAFVFGIFTYVRDPESAWSNTPGAGTVKTLPKVIVLFALMLGLSSCALYQAKTMDENIAQIKALDGSGCIYFRGNSRPWADVSMLTVATWGKNAPKYIDCLQNIPADARALLP